VFRLAVGLIGLATEKNPAELKTAVIFAAIYAVVLLAVAVAKEHFGSTGFTLWRSLLDSRTWTRLRFRRPVWSCGFGLFEPRFDNRPF